MQVDHWVKIRCVDQMQPYTAGNNGPATRRRRPVALGTKRESIPGGQKIVGASSMVELASQWSMGSSGFFTSASLLQQILHLSGAESLTSPFHESQWVRACIKIIANALIQAPPRFYFGDPLDDDNARILGTDTSLNRLFRSPNAHQSGSTFRVANLTHVKLEGETIWFLMDRNGSPVGDNPDSRAPIPMPTTIVSLMGSCVTIKRDRNGAIYNYPVGDGTSIPFPASSVVHFREYDPHNILDGAGDVEAILRDLAAEFQAQRYNEGLLANGGQPGGWIISKRPMDNTARRQEEEKLRDATRNANNASAWHLIDGLELDVKPNTLRPRDMEFGSQREWVFRAVARVMGVPLPLLGDMEHATFANMEQARRMLWTGGNGVISYLRAEEDTINSFFLPRIVGLGSSASAGRVVLRHDLSVVPDLQEDAADLLERASSIANLGVGLSLKDAAEVMGLDVDLPDTAGVVLVPAGKVPLDRLLDQASSLDAGEEDPDDGEGPAVEEESVVPTATRASSTWQPRVGLVHATRSVRADHTAHDRYVPRMERALLTYLRRYARAQIARLEAFAERGDDALSMRRKLGVTGGNVWLPSLTERDILDLFLDPDEWIGRLTRSVTPVVRHAFNASASALAQQLGTSAITAESATVVAGLSEQVFKLTYDVHGSVARRTRRAVVDLIASSGEGLGMVPIQDAIRELLPELRGTLRQVYRDKDARALAIARTEIGTATSTAVFEQSMHDGAESSRWITAGDEVVRDAHRLLDGEVRRLGDEFARRLRFPHDLTAPPEQRINCRCDMEIIFR